MSNFMNQNNHISISWYQHKIWVSLPMYFNIQLLVLVAVLSNLGNCVSKTSGDNWLEYSAMDHIACATDPI